MNSTNWPDSGAEEIWNEQEHMRDLRRYHETLANELESQKADLKKEIAYENFVCHEAHRLLLVNQLPRTISGRIALVLEISKTLQKYLSLPGNSGKSEVESGYASLSSKHWRHAPKDIISKVLTDAKQKIILRKKEISDIITSSKARIVHIQSLDASARKFKYDITSLKEQQSTRIRSNFAVIRQILENSEISELNKINAMHEADVLSARNATESLSKAQQHIESVHSSLLQVQREISNYANNDIMTVKILVNQSMNSTLEESLQATNVIQQAERAIVDPNDYSSIKQYSRMHDNISARETDFVDEVNLLVARLLN